MTLKFENYWTEILFLLKLKVIYTSDVLSPTRTFLELLLSGSRSLDLSQVATASSALPGHTQCLQRALGRSFKSLLLTVSPISCHHLYPLLSLPASHSYQLS